MKATGWKPSKTRGWRTLAKGQVVTYRTGVSRELSVGVVLYNDINQQQVEVHTCRSVWSGTAVKHHREYRRVDGEGDEIVLEPTDQPVKCIVFYLSLIHI